MEELFIENDASFNILNEEEVISKIHEYLKLSVSYFSPSLGIYLRNCFMNRNDLEKRFIDRLKKEIDHLKQQPLGTITPGVILEALEKVKEEIAKE